jgi:hypothetical protein
VEVEQALLAATLLKLVLAILDQTVMPEEKVEMV